MGEIESDELDMLLNVLDLDEKLVTEVMVPRIDMECADVASTIRQVAETITGGDAHSRIPIYRESKDQIVGMVHAKDLLTPLLEGRTEDPISGLLRPPFFIPETATLDKVLNVFKANGVHIAIVQDEYGGTSGLVTLDDILEEIVGEIQDEYDAERPDEIEVLEDGSLLISGRVMLDDLEEEFDIHLDSEQVDSIGGYLTEMAGRIPHEGEFFTLEGRRFTVREADAKQISLIHVQALPTQSVSKE
ncbi:hemolysin family protein [Salidesulfovibrio onnuriiensis]|uniref:hemolysin family protein n=1 Tax=Salidesulfovibrio onnuriiensis TaxID=2583823 RepID=UPI0032B72EC5